MKSAELRTLVALAEARKARDLARLEALTAERRALEAEIVELGRTEARDRAAGADLPTLARRLAWAEAAIASHRRRIAAVAREIAGLRDAARVSIGKHEALGTLLARAERTESAARDRAEEIALLAARRRDG